MTPNLFHSDALQPQNIKWNTCITREDDIYVRPEEIRSEFERDYNRILHCTAYRRLKHKTQVFYATRNDHVCTRIEHVNHVTSVSYTISKYLGLNTELTNAIAIGHDLGHAPFGHSGEKILKAITENELSETFWHERNSLRVIDKIETLENSFGKLKNLNLTYAVRDGIVSHCGEVNENALFPRIEIINLEEIKSASQYSPYTWEGCIVKLADKISYLGRDIEDAIRLKILNEAQIDELKMIVDVDLQQVNNTILIYDFVTDLCSSSSPKEGLRFSEKHLELINRVKEFNYKNIYYHKRLTNYYKYAELVINSICNSLKGYYSGNDTYKNLAEDLVSYPILVNGFTLWLKKYSNINMRTESTNKYENTILYNLENERDYKQAIIDYIATMTDYFAIDVFNELTSF